MQLQKDYFTKINHLIFVDVFTIFVLGDSWRERELDDVHEAFYTVQGIGS